MTAALKHIVEYPAPNPTYKKIKRTLYLFAKALGLFALSRLMTRKKLRILTFHGFSMEDEHEWNPGLFHAPREFKKRLEVIQSGRYPVLDLDEAYQKLKSGTLPDCATVITIDDGFYNNHKLGIPLLKEFGFKHTVYVTSYYVTHQTPIFRLLMQYAVWKSKKIEVTLPELEWNTTLPQFKGTLNVADTLWPLIHFAESQLNEPKRQIIAQNFCAALGVDYQKIVQERKLGLMTPDELAALEKNGLTRIELHAHRHTIGNTPQDLEKEITQNREVLEPILGRKLLHFCYPSGIWNKEAWPVLERARCLTSTIADPGLNDEHTHPLALWRYLDRQDNSNIELEAELTGFASLLRGLVRQIKGKIKGRLRG